MSVYLYDLYSSCSYLKMYVSLLCPCRWIYPYRNEYMCICISFYGMLVCLYQFLIEATWRLGPGSFKWGYRQQELQAGWSVLFNVFPGTSIYLNPSLGSSIHFIYTCTYVYMCVYVFTCIRTEMDTYASAFVSLVVFIFMTVSHWR